MPLKNRTEKSEVRKVKIFRVSTFLHSGFRPGGGGLRLKPL